MSDQPPALYWHRRANDWLDFPLGRFLDYGCGSGVLLALVRDRCREAYGVDVDPDGFPAVSARLPGVRLDAIGLDGRTPYPDDFFDSAAIVEVIEHVPDERATLRELCRVLKPGGRLVLTTPHRGMLTFLDVGNVKFVLPGLHRLIHRHLLPGTDYYEQRFVRARSLGLIGDISVVPGRVPWHRHYIPRQIVRFCDGLLVLERFAVYFPAMRALMFARQTLRMLTRGRRRELPWPLPAIEQRLGRVRTHAGDQLVMLLRKPA